MFSTNSPNPPIIEFIILLTSRALYTDTNWSVVNSWRHSSAVRLNFLRQNAFACTMGLLNILPVLVQHLDAIKGRDGLSLYRRNLLVLDIRGLG